MAIVVQKYGGSSVADVERIREIAKKVVYSKKEGNDVVVVVSAMGKTTNELVSLARAISEAPPRRELDMLLTVGERITSSLLSIAIGELGYEAVSLTGSQCGILTNDRHSDARIIEVRPHRVEDELARGRIVIVAGFQGVSYKREITTLGRGGSDTTAVALAAALGAERCEIYSDVDGVYSADPNSVDDAQHLPEISYEEMQEMSVAGAKVLKDHAVEFAKRAGIALYARSTFSPGRETVVRKDTPDVHHGVRAVVSERDVALVVFRGEAVRVKTAELLDAVENSFTPIKELRFQCPEENVTWARGSFVVSTSTLPDWNKTRQRLLIIGGDELEIREGLAAISLIGVAVNKDNNNVLKVMDVLNEINTPILGLSTTRFRISLIANADHVDEAVQRLHDEFVVGGVG